MKGYILFGAENNAIKITFNSDFEITILFPTPTPKLEGFPVKQKTESAFSLVLLPFVKREKFDFS